MILQENSEYITVFVLDGRKNLLGVGMTHLRACRQIQTGTGRFVGWYLRQINLLIQQPGKIHHIVTILPNGHRWESPVEDFGLTQLPVTWMQQVTLSDLRVLHPEARAIMLASRKEQAT